MIIFVKSFYGLCMVRNNKSLQKINKSNQNFSGAGYEVTDEYTIGVSTALSFLSDNDPVKHALRELWESRHVGGIYNNFHQGYLLVTIGQNPDYKKS